MRSRICLRKRRHLHFCGSKNAYLADLPPGSPVRDDRQIRRGKRGKKRMTIQEAQKNMEEAIRQTPEFQEYQKAKDAAFADSLSAQLLTEYGRLQNKLQMFAVTGRQAEDSEVERFKQLGGLLFATPVTGSYLMAQLRVQKLLADIFADLSKAAGIAIELPSLS